MCIRDRASAVDNGGGKVRRLDVYVDDVVVDTICGANATVTIPADTFTMPRRRECMDDSHPESCEWETGPHMIDFVAENDSGKKARRRFVVYAGDTWIVDIGTRFIDENTEVTFRSLAPASMKARVRLRIFEAKTLSLIHI